MSQVLMFSSPFWCFNDGVISGEREYLLRLQQALDNLNQPYILTNHMGQVLDPISKKKNGQTCADYDVMAHFAVHMSEFAFFDIYSVVALWNPLMFVSHIEMYHPHIKHKSKDLYSPYASYDDYLSPSNKQSQIFNAFVNTDAIKQIKHLPYFPSVSQSNILDPAQKFDKIFYVGTGWENIVPGRDTRHGYELSKLSEQGLLDIYGPANNWQNKTGVNYKGELPADGQSVINQINQSGITLALASSDHVRADILTNRIFEGISAGSMVISNIKGTAYEMFNDNILYIDYTAEPEQRFQQILQHYQWIQDNPEECRKMIENCQNILREKYCLEILLKNIVEQIPQRKNELQKIRELTTDNAPAISVNYQCIDNVEQIKADLDQILKQNYSNLQINIFTKKHADLVKQHVEQNNINNHKINIISELNEHKDLSDLMNYLSIHDKNQYMTIFNPLTLWKHNHLSILMRLLNDNPEKQLAFCKNSIYNRENNKDVNLKHEFYGNIDVETNDYQKLYQEIRQNYVNVSAMLWHRDFINQHIEANTTGYLKDLIGFYLLMCAIANDKLIQSQYILCASNMVYVNEFLKYLAAEDVLLIKYLFPLNIYENTTAEHNQPVHQNNQNHKDYVMQKYLNYKKRWQKKNIISKIFALPKLRFLRKQYKFWRDM